MERNARNCLRMEFVAEQKCCKGDRMKRNFLVRCIRAMKRRTYLFLINHVFVGTARFEIKRRLLNSLGYKIGEGTKVVGPIECYADLTIGRDCWIGKNFKVNGNGTLVIGDNCDIAPEVTFLTGGHKVGDKHRRAGLGESYTITVGNGVWIGGRSTLLNNIYVGNGSVIAACACVNKNVKENELVGGVPARVIRVLDDDLQS